MSSGHGSALQGAVLYAYYGREDDLRQLQDIGMDMRGRVLLVRVGKNSYAEKVGDYSEQHSASCENSLSHFFSLF